MLCLSVRRLLVVLFVIAETRTQDSYESYQRSRYPEKFELNNLAQAAESQGYLGDLCKAPTDCRIAHSECITRTNFWKIKQSFCLCKEGFESMSGGCAKSAKTIPLKTTTPSPERVEASPGRSPTNLQLKVDPALLSQIREVFKHAEDRDSPMWTTTRATTTSTTTTLLDSMEPADFVAGFIEKMNGPQVEHNNLSGQRTQFIQPGLLLFEGRPDLHQQMIDSVQSLSTDATGELIKPRLERINGTLVATERPIYDETFETPPVWAYWLKSPTTLPETTTVTMKQNVGRPHSQHPPTHHFRSNHTDDVRRSEHAVPADGSLVIPGFSNLGSNGETQKGGRLQLPSSWDYQHAKPQVPVRTDGNYGMEQDQYEDHKDLDKDDSFPTASLADLIKLLLPPVTQSPATSTAFPEISDLIRDFLESKPSTTTTAAPTTIAQVIPITTPFSEEGTKPSVDSVLLEEIIKALSGLNHTISALTAPPTTTEPMAVTSAESSPSSQIPNVGTQLDNKAATTQNMRPQIQLSISVEELEDVVTNVVDKVVQKYFDKLYAEVAQSTTLPPQIRYYQLASNYLKNQNQPLPKILIS